MECLWSNIVKFCKVVWSYFVALARLVVWTAVFFFSGLQRTLFMRSEIVGVDFRVMPLRCDVEDVNNKLSYLDKLCIENPDLIGMEDDEIDTLNQAIYKTLDKEIDNYHIDQNSLKTYERTRQIQRLKRIVSSNEYRGE